MGSDALLLLKNVDRSARKASQPEGGEHVTLFQ